MKIKFSVVGVSEESFPAEPESLQVNSRTVQDLLDSLFNRYGAHAAAKLFDSNGLRPGLSLLVNGRNVLSLPDRYQTRLQDLDEIVITVRVTGG
ncbi:MAG: MoaD/ThiS family protein [Candidatus Abyssobacteria bacterium SURF_5]|uniref:MoaD/ThiS family protein n=1 Tax=Abyssobacteria bacterium (strain SURF_5) TaxID=2093360 RepID=A0A3A4NV59_ABYX5|nr:MAG: MoaD/ThiS family protein [Candidatus Abyssubacteria bacterium SURF_5]